MTPLRSIGVAAALLLYAAPGAAQNDGGDVGDCLITFDRIPSTAPKFGDFPASESFSGKPARIAVKGNRAARQFRNQLAEGAASGPNFAGQYTVVSWGCGAACLDWAVIDARSGAVNFDSKMRDVSAASVGESTPGPGAEDSFAVLRFTRDSRLLIVLGAPHEDARRDGIAYLEWTGKTFRPVAFFPRDQVCRR
jgi:hypothetical protein